MIRMAFCKLKCSSGNTNQQIVIHEEVLSVHFSCSFKQYLETIQVNITNHNPFLEYLSLNEEWW